MNIDFNGLFTNMSVTQWIVVGIVAFMFLTGKLKLADLLNIFKPSPTPTPTPTPVVDPNNPVVIPTPSPNTPIVTLITQLLPVLLPLFLKARASGNKELEDATTTLMKQALPPQS